MHEALALGHLDRHAEPVKGFDQRLDIRLAEQHLS